MNRCWVGCLVLASALLAGACHRSPPEGPTPAEEAAEDTGPIPLHIDNHNFSDIVVIVGYSSTQVRLGTARGLTHTELSFPSAYARGGGPLVLIAAPIGSMDRFTSERFFVQPGQDVSWTLEARLVQSSVSVR
jgi:hypothetical protein